MTDQKKAIFKVFINGSMEDVWREITRTDVPLRGIFNARMHVSGPLEPGARIQMRSESGKLTMVIGEVTEFEPPRRFAHTHRFTQYDDPFCKVIYDLVPKEGGVELTLTVDDMPLGTKTAKDMMGGGTMIVNTIKAIVENGQPGFGTRLMYAMFGKMEWVLPKIVHAENWPLK